MSGDCIRGDRETPVYCGPCFDALHAEVQSLRLALDGAETCIRLEQEAQQELRSAISELLVETAEAQREACAKVTEETWPENPVRAARIRATPLVTETKP